MKLRRRPALAGQFYPAGESDCTRQIDRFVDRPAVVGAIGGLVPHAGWFFSGETAGCTIGALAGARPETVVIFGAVHVLDRNLASVYPSGEWESPLGSMKIDDQLATALLQCPDTTADAAIHAREHSIEVEIPLVQRVFPDAMILPVMVRPTDRASGVGRALAEAVIDLGRSVTVLASTDLTHYGPRFGFEPAGHGIAGIRWAKDVNDRRFVGCVAGMDAAAVVPEAMANHNACGAGAVAATIAAVEALGASRYLELSHTTSADREGMDDPGLCDSVGYQAGVFVAAP